MTSMCRLWHSDLRDQSSVNLSISMGIGSFENSGWCLCSASIIAAFPLLHLQGNYCVLSQLVTELLFLKDDETLRLPHKEPLRTESYQELAFLTERCSFSLLSSASLTLPRILCLHRHCSLCLLYQPPVLLLSVGVAERQGRERAREGGSECLEGIPSKPSPFL